MPFSSVLTFIRYVVYKIPWEHWVIMGVVAVAVALLFSIRKKYSGYGGVALGFAVMIGLSLLDAAVVNRIGVQIEQHPEFNLVAEFQRLFHGTMQHRVQLVSNIAVFIPFGFFVSEFLSETRSISAKRCLFIVAITGFLLSLSIEVCQWILRVGLFELTDLVMNTIGATIGSIAALGIRALVHVCIKKKAK